MARLLLCRPMGTGGKVGRVPNSHSSRHAETGRPLDAVWSHRRAGAFILAGGAIFWVVVLFVLFGPQLP